MSEIQITADFATTYSKKYGDVNCILFNSRFGAEITVVGKEEETSNWYLEVNPITVDFQEVEDGKVEISFQDTEGVSYLAVVEKIFEG